MPPTTVTTVAPATPAAPLAAAPLALTGIAKRWPDQVVADAVDLVLAPGELVRITGRNGVGKTTLMRIAAGLIGPDAGAVRAFGLDPMGDRRAFHTVTAFLSTGSSGLYARLDPTRHLDLAGRLALLPGAERRARVARELERMELAPFARRRVDRLSMGQRQRVRMAMTLVGDPRLLILDEPMNSLDDEGVALLDRAVVELLGAGGAVLWAAPTADPSTLRPDRRFVLADGRLTEE